VRRPHIGSFLSYTPVLAILALGVQIPSYGAAQGLRVYVINTVVGSGPRNVESGGYGGDGGPATRALINTPTGVALDAAGNLFFCDWNARIRKVAVGTGIITTVAGTGTAGYSGDGGPATSAELGGPGSVAVDAAAHIYFADVDNYRVRQISAETGIITTIAGNGSELDSGDGGLAINAGIGLAAGIAVDQAGNLYFTNGADRVRKVETATGIITTIAGAGGSFHSGDGGPAVLAQLAQPSGVAVDGEGNIYIAARGEHRIRKISASTGIITTVAGASPGADSGVMGIWVYQGGFSGDGGPATAALLDGAEYIAVDKAGNLYIPDTFNYRVRRVDAITGNITTIAGTGVKGFSGDDGLAVSAEMTTPSGIAVDRAGWIYFGDLFNHRIRVLRPVELPWRFDPPTK
jgi:sugar lactone lactonase YvrE